jgi:hypothetical protein
MRDGINEVIATIAMNAAPIGIISRAGTLQAALFLTSHTAALVERDRRLVANLTHDPVLYVQTAFSDLAPEAFTQFTVDGVSMCRLADAEAWTAFSVEVIRKTGATLLVHLVPIAEEICDVQVYPVNRGFSSVIEATVHATRYCINRDPWLKQLIDHHCAIVRRCGGPRELEAVALLTDEINRCLTTS